MVNVHNAPNNVESAAPSIPIIPTKYMEQSKLKLALINVIVLVAKGLLNANKYGLTLELMVTRQAAQINIIADWYAV